MAGHALAKTQTRVVRMRANAPCSLVPLASFSGRTQRTFTALTRVVLAQTITLVVHQRIRVALILVPTVTSAEMALICSGAAAISARNQTATHVANHLPVAIVILVQAVTSTR